MSNLKELIHGVSKASPLATPLRMMFGQIQNQQNANETYNAVRPLLDDALMSGYRFESQEVQGIVAILRELPADGARQRNFEKRYLMSESGLRELPRFASGLNSAYWH